MYYDYTIHKLLQPAYGFKTQPEEVGLEIELEGTNLIIGDLPYYWLGHNDGSLRAVDNHPPQEYTLRSPVSQVNVLKVLNYLVKKLADNNASVSLSQRTSVHVHINVQTLTFKQTINYLVLYFIFEELLTEYAGGHLRRGNLFCLRAMDAEYITTILKRVCKNPTKLGLVHGETDNLKYHACNISALTQFGSLEFRAHKGCIDPKRIEQWVNILLRLKKSAMSFSDPQAIVSSFSSMGLEVFTRSVFGTMLPLIYSYSDNQKLWNGLRLAQDIAYSVTDWNKVSSEQKETPTTAEYETTFDTATSVYINSIPPDGPIVTTTSTWADPTTSHSSTFTADSIPVSSGSIVVESDRIVYSMDLIYSGVKPKTVHLLSDYPCVSSTNQFYYNKSNNVWASNPNYPNLPT